MRYISASTALIHGTKMCLNSRSRIKLALWPWAIGAFSYVVSLLVIFNFHSSILSSLVQSSSGFWGGVFYVFCWILLTVVMLIAAMVLSLILVLMLSGTFHTAIAHDILRELEVELPEEAPGIGAMTQEIFRSITVESFKLLWLGPLFIFVFFLGFFPLLLPFTIIIGAWLLAFQFIDIILDIYKIGVFNRLKFALSNLLLLICFGLSLTLCFAIPFLGLFITPFAVSAAAWLFAKESMHKRIGE